MGVVESLSSPANIRSMLPTLVVTVLVLANVVNAQAPYTMFVNNGQGKDSTLTLGGAGGKATMHSQNNEFKLTMNNNEVLNFLPLETNVDNAFTPEVLGTMRIGSFAANSIIANDFEARNEESPNQNWLAVAVDTFSNGTDGWSIIPVAVNDDSADVADLVTTQCGGVGKVLGGPCQTSYHTVEKVYKNLPNHAEIQVTARVHFIDNWDDDTMWLKVGQPGLVGSTAPVWAEEYTWCPQFFTFMCQHGVSVCGKGHYPDKMSRLVTVTMQHTSPDVALQFGTDMKTDTPACETSFAVSQVSIEVR